MAAMEGREGTRPWITRKAEALWRRQVTYTELLPSERIICTRSQHNSPVRRMKKKIGFHLSLFFLLIREEAWLDTVLQVSEIPVSDVVPKGETC